MKNSSDLNLWYKNQDWLLESLTKTFRTETQSLDSSDIQMHHSKNLTYCHISNKFMVLKKNDKKFELKVYDISKSVDQKNAQVLCHEIQFLDSKSKNQVSDLDDHAFEIEINENDDTLICIKVSKLITHNGQSRPHNETKSFSQTSNHTYCGNIPAFKNPVMISHIFIGVYKSDQEQLQFLKVHIEGSARQVSWHPQSAFHLNILGITADQSKIFGQEKFQHLYVFNCGTSLILPEIDINLSQSLIVQRKKNPKKHQFVAFNFQKQSLSYTDYGYLTVYLLTQTGKIYYISPFFVSDQMIPYKLLEYARSQHDEFSLKLKNQLEENNQKCLQIKRYSSSFKDGLVSLSKLKIMKYSKESCTDYCFFQKISFTNHHIFLLVRKEVKNGDLKFNIVMTCSQIQIQAEQTKVTAYEIYTNQVVADNTISNFSKYEQEKKNTTLQGESGDNNQTKQDMNKVMTLIQSIQPKQLQKKVSFYSREQIIVKYDELSVDMKNQFFISFMVEYFIYKSTLIVLDLASLHKFEVKNDPSTLNILIKSIQLEDVEMGIRDAELIGNFQPQAMIFNLNQKESNIVTISSENINSLTIQKLDLFASDTLDKLPVPNEVKAKYRHIGNRLAKVKQFMVEKLEQLLLMDESNPTFQKYCETLTDNIQQVVNNDLVQVAAHVQTMNDEAILSMEINRQVLDDLNIQTEDWDLNGMCLKLQENNQSILQQLTIIENSDDSNLGRIELYDQLNKQAQTLQYQMQGIRDEYKNQIMDLSHQVESMNVNKSQADEIEILVRDKTDKISKLLDQDIQEIKKKLKQ